MKKAPDRRNDTGAAVVGSPIFTHRVSSVRAEVLANLLDGRSLTGMDAVIGMSTTRLADHIHVLRGCGWKLETEDKIVATADGRVTTVAEYTMPTGERERGFAAGAAEWIERVRAARKAQRERAHEARAEVYQRNSLATSSAWTRLAASMGVG